MNETIKIKNLSISSKNETIVKNINLELSSNEPLILLGESGSGKSLIFDCIMGTLDKNLFVKGNIYLNDIDLLKLNDKEKRKLWGNKIAFLPQEPWTSLDPTMKISEQVKEVHKYLHKSNNPEEKTLDNLKSVNLENAKDLYPFEISGGMAQRVSIAITNAINARILLVDEPTKGLDKTLCKIIAKQIEKEIEKKKLVFIISHDFDLVKNLNLNIAIMKDGEIIEKGTFKNLYQNSINPYTKELFNSEVKNWNFQKKDLHNKLTIEVSNLSKSFGSKSLFKNLNFKLYTKQITSVVAPSGFGKSTLGDILLDLQKPTNGKIKKYDKNKLRYQKIYQDPISCFLPTQLIEEGLFDLIKLHNLTKNDLFDFMKSLKLDKSIIKRFPSEVSGGELQRLSLIRILLLKPIFIFADEITSRLDLLSQKEVIFLLRDIVEKFDISVLLVTHDLEIAKKISHKIIYLEEYK